MIMNHREILHSFDAIATPDITSFAACCKSKLPPTSVQEIRVCIQSQLIDAERFTSELTRTTNPAPIDRPVIDEPVIDPPATTKPKIPKGKVKGD